MGGQKIGAFRVVKNPFLEQLMTYKSILPESLEDIEVNYFSSAEESSHIATIQTGYNDETSEVYSVMVVLQPAIGKPPEHQELQFYFVVANEDVSDSCEEISDGRQTKAIISPSERGKVLHVVCSLAQYVVDVVKPDELHYITVDADMPPKALVKYRLLCQAICEVGYRGGEVDPYLGTHMWILKRT